MGIKKNHWGNLPIFIVMVWGLNSCSLFVCSNKVIREIASPDRTRKAVVFERDCGATDGGSTQVSILNADAVLPTNKSSNTFVIKYYPKLNVIWQGDHNLIIQHPESTRIFTRETKVNDVSIRYEVQKLEF